MTKEQFYLTAKEAASHLKVSSQTLANWRHLKKGPPYIKMSGSKVIYRCSDLDAYLEAQRIDPEKIAMKRGSIVETANEDRTVGGRQC